MTTIDISCVAPHFRERGKGETVLLIHSAGNSGSQWDAVASLLENKFRLVAPDLYDCGETDAWTRNCPMHFDDAANLLVPLLQQYGRVHLVGHSFGGGVALRLAAMYPEKIRSLTLIEPAAYQVLQEIGREELWLEFLEVKDRFKKAAERGDYETAWQPFFDYYCSHAVPWRMLPETTRLSIMQKTQAQLNVYGAQETNPTRLSDIRRLNCPTLVIQGECTNKPECGLCEEIVANAPSGYGAVVAGAAHMVPLTHADTVADLLRSHFLDPAKMRSSR